MKVKVKICGIKTLDAAKKSIDAGADFLGFNFVPASKRLISAETAKLIIDALPKEILKVGVFMNADIADINNLINILKLDYVQLHASEQAEHLSLINGVKIIKTFSLSANFDVARTLEKMKKYKVDYFLLDRKKQGKGELLNLDKVCKLAATYPIILSGGLTSENVKEAIKVVQPYAVDVATGVETEGKKDIEKIQKFISEAKQYE